MKLRYVAIMILMALVLTSCDSTGLSRNEFESEMKQMEASLQDNGVYKYNGCEVWLEVFDGDKEAVKGFFIKALSFSEIYPKNLVNSEGGILSSYTYKSGDVKIRIRRKGTSVLAVSTSSVDSWETLDEIFRHLGY